MLFVLIAICCDLVFWWVPDRLRCLRSWAVVADGVVGVCVVLAVVLVWFGGCLFWICVIVLFVLDWF